MVRFVRTLQHRVTPQGRGFYSLSIPPQVAEALNLKAGGSVDIIVTPAKKNKFEVTLKPTPVELNQSLKEV
jgi:bifunctional DNA-binding transcriptional regulator/antitoxin component of YhaV-PrlF toxin-antitoxin module